MVVVIHVSNVYSRSYGIISNSSYLVSIIFNTVSRISVPIFFMISGSLLLDREFNKKKYFKRLLKYIVIIIVWDIIYLIWEYFFLGVTYNKLYKLLFEPYRAHLWFLYSILFLYFVQPLLKKILDKSNNIVKIILLICWLSFSLLSIYNSFIANYFTAFSYIGFFVMGKYIKEFIDNNDLRKYNLLFVILILISFGLSIFSNYYSSLKYDVFYNMFFAYRTPFIITSSFSFFILICSNYRKDKISKIISIISDSSFGVYLIHGIFLDIAINLFIYNSIPSIIGIPVFSILISICSIISVYLLKRIKCLNYIM